MWGDSLARLALDPPGARYAPGPPDLHVLPRYPAGSREAIALVGDAGKRLLVVAPTGADGVLDEA